MPAAYPRLFHIGTQKAGSTYLYNILAQHPDLSLPKIKEPAYFTTNYERGLEWYSGLFEGEGIRLDTTPKYFQLGEKAAPRIKEYADRHLAEPPRFLLILRNPVDYLNSHFEMQKYHGFFRNNPGDYPEPMDKLIDHLRRYPKYLERARYAKILRSHWLSRWPLENFLIVYFEDFIADPNGTANRICRFFGVSEHEFNTANQVSRNKMLRNDWLFRLQSWTVKREGIKNVLKKSRLFNYAYKNVLTGKSGSKLPPGDRREIAAMLKPDVAELEVLLGKKIEVWPDFK